jgi:hypothetical protein
MDVDSPNVGNKRKAEEERTDDTKRLTSASRDVNTNEKETVSATAMREDSSSPSSAESANDTHKRIANERNIDTKKLRMSNDKDEHV